MDNLLGSAWQALLRSRVTGTLVSVIPWAVRRSFADLLLLGAPSSESSLSSNPGPFGTEANSGYTGSGSNQVVLDERVPCWVRDAFTSLWLGSGDIAVERHGISFLAYCPSDLSGLVTMVREDYLQLWDFIKDAHNGKHYEGLVVTGQPGTGKSRFLHYALAKALKERIPVAFCENSRDYYFCDGTGCRLYSTSHLVLHDVEPGKLFLALVDSNTTMESPPQAFINRAQHCYTVQATSPQPGRWRSWTKERDASEYWVTTLWTKDEVRNLQHFYEEEGLCPWKDNEANYYSPLEVFDLVGPSARTCFSAGGHPRSAGGPKSDFNAYLRPNDIFLRSDDLIATLTTGIATSPQQGPNFHRLFFASKPDGASNPMPYDPAFHYSVPTDLVSQILFDYFKQRSVEDQVSLLSKFAPYPQLMGLVFEPLVLQFLTSSRTPIPCHLVDGSTIMLGPGLRLATLQVDPDMTIEPRHNDVHVPRKGFPSLDAFIITINKDRIEVLLLQMTVASTHDVVSKGIAAVIKLMGRSTKNLSVKFIFVTPGPSGEKMAKKLQNIKIQGRPPVVVEVGWIETGELLSCPDKVLNELIRLDADNLKVDDEEIDDEPSAKGARTT